jgi:hypothetical protein
MSREVILPRFIVPEYVCETKLKCLIQGIYFPDSMLL